MRRAIIHIGMPRTGSTSLQEVLARLRPRLPEAGILYPRLAPTGSGPGADVNHQPLGEALDGRRSRSERRAALARLDAALANTQADTVILSYEDFAVQRPHFRVPATLAEAFGRHGFALEVAMVVKPAFEQLNSAYAHRAQLVQETRTFRAYGQAQWRSGRFDYGALIAPWRAAAEGRVTVIPLRDRRSAEPLLGRIVRDLGLADRLGGLIAGQAEYRTNRSPGPIAVEASRRLRLQRVHRQVAGHPRRIGHVLDDAAWGRGLDPESFRGDAPEIRARMGERLAASHDRFARAMWGASWDAVVGEAPERAPNELAGRSLDAETEAVIAALMRETMGHFRFHSLPAWQRVPADLAEAATKRLAGLVGYGWRVS
ncbi:hypothetical protein [Methylobacterium sp. A54F]